MTEPRGPCEFPPTGTYEEYLAILRESIAEAKAGVGLMTVAEAMARTDAELERLAAEGKR